MVYIFISSIFSTMYYLTDISHTKIKLHNETGLTPSLPKDTLSQGTLYDSTFSLADYYAYILTI